MCYPCDSVLGLCMGLQSILVAIASSIKKKVLEQREFCQKMFGLSVCRVSPILLWARPRMLDVHVSLVAFLFKPPNRQ